MFKAIRSRLNQEFIIGKHNVEAVKRDPSLREEILMRQRSRGIGPQAVLDEHRKYMADLAVLAAWYDETTDEISEHFTVDEVKRMAKCIRISLKVNCVEENKAAMLSRVVVGVCGAFAGWYLAQD